MTTNYVLIDLENTQPENLELLADRPFKVLVFLGGNQAKISSRFAVARQNLGKEGQYIEMSGNGPNALDFHIAYYLGKFAANHPKSCFYIVSKDKGFDPLIRHLSGKNHGKIKVRRITCLKALPGLAPNKIPIKSDEGCRLQTIVENLIQRGASKPRTIKTLRNTIHTLFAKQLSESELQKLMNELVARKIVHIEGQKVAYSIPHSPEKPKEKTIEMDESGEQLLIG